MAAIAGGITELHVRVVAARNLKDTQTFGTQDPFCVLKAGNQKFKTRVHDNGGLHPVWGEKFVFQIYDPNLDQLHISCKNKNFTESKMIGECRLQVSQFKSGNVIDEWFALTKGNRRTGDINLRVQLIGNGVKAKAPKAAATGYPTQAPVYQQPGYAPQPSYPPQQPGYGPPPQSYPHPGQYPPQTAYPSASAPGYGGPNQAAAQQYQINQQQQQIQMQQAQIHQQQMQYAQASQPVYMPPPQPMVYHQPPPAVVYHQPPTVVYTESRRGGGGMGGVAAGAGLGLAGGVLLGAALGGDDGFGFDFD